MGVSDVEAPIVVFQRDDRTSALRLAHTDDLWPRRHRPRRGRFMPGKGNPPCSPAHLPPGPSHAECILAGPAQEITVDPGTRLRFALTFHGAGDPTLTERALSVFAAAP